MKFNIFIYFTNGFTFWSWGLAMGNAVWLFTDGDTFWAIFSFTSLIWAFDFTFWFFTFNITDGVSWFLTRSVA
jgi:hypothetical protein